VVRKGKTVRRILARYGENCSTHRKVYHGYRISKVAVQMVVMTTRDINCRDFLSNQKHYSRMASGSLYTKASNLCRN